MRTVVSLVDSDDSPVAIEHRQFIATALERSGIECQYTPWIEGVHKDATIVVADPRNFPTAAFVATFREHYQIPLVVASGRSDILSGTRTAHNVAAITKPFHLAELAELLTVVLEPQGISEDPKEC